MRSARRHEGRLANGVLSGVSQSGSGLKGGDMGFGEWHASPGRHFVIRNDYGLYEYTVYVYHDPI